MESKQRLTLEQARQDGERPQGPGARRLQEMVERAVGKQGKVLEVAAFSSSV